MTRLDTDDELSSWLESRRLIVAQLKAMDSSIRELSGKIDLYNDTARDRTSDVAEKTRDAVNELKVRVAMLEVRAQIWGGALGFIAGGLSSLIVSITHSFFVGGMK